MLIFVMEKYFDSAIRRIAAATIVILIIAVLLIPEPKYYKYKACLGNSLSTGQEKCGSNIIEWGPSIAQRLRSQYINEIKPPEAITIPPASLTVTKYWDIYKNEEYNFQFKHPKYLSIVNEDKDRFSYILSLALPDEIELIDTFDLNIVITSDESSKNNLNFCIENAGKIEKGPAYNYEGKQLWIGNDLLKLGEYEGCMQKMGGENKLVYNILMQRNDKIYTIQFLTEGDINTIDTLTNQILSTFSFIED
jgi:hypothetical protein